MTKNSYRKPKLLFYGDVESLTKAQLRGAVNDCSQTSGQPTDLTDESDFFDTGGSCG
jgi:hypothetical protein